MYHYRRSTSKNLDNKMTDELKLELNLNRGIKFLGRDADKA
jgi:hypothetical protein